LTMPDLTMPDLTMPDLTMPDLTMPDLVKEDMVVSPDLLTSPVSFTMQGTVTNFNGVNVAFATGDFTVDNKQDLVVAARDSGIRILRGVGDGSFVLNPNAYGASQGLRVCVAGNLNGDAKPDLVTTGASGNGTLHTMINDAMMGGQGSFKIANEWSVGGTLPWRLVVNDWNMDGNMDVAVILSGGVVSVLRGDGAGGFAANPVKLTFMNPTNLASADWSGDGLSDLAVLTSKGVELVKGWGNGTFQAPVITTLPGGITPQGLVGGNFDGDTWLDMAVSFGGAGGGVVLLQGAPNGVFTVGGQASVNVSNTVAGLVVGDFNKDKVMDFVVGNVGVQKFTLFLGEGKAKVKPGITFGSGSDPIDLTLGDWNGDGKSDIAILSATQITVALNTTP
ncbi:VCBS repeat-containing protein, partial [Candidatus Uhrbacteria bacterium]|nr:VCBS repeat-containing protein [Candidatus Uhrbacteria bacterium]